MQLAIFLQHASRLENSCLGLLVGILLRITLSLSCMATKTL